MMSLLLRLAWPGLAAGLWALPLAPASAQSGGMPFLEQRVQRDPEDILARNLLAGEYLQAFRRTGDADFIRRAADSAEASLKVLGEPGNAGAFAARGAVNLARHRFPEALADAETYRKLKPESLTWRELKFDALVELHRLEEASALGAEMKQRVGESLGWHGRMARLARARGDLALEQKHWTGAVAFARSELSVITPAWKAWAFLQRGGAALVRGDFAAAEADFQEARKIDDSWQAAERLGELRGAQGRWDECLELLRAAAAKSKSPGTAQAVADALIASGKPGEAKEWLDRAEAGYRVPAERGEVFYLHHLASFYADSRLNPMEAVKCARQDLALRRTPDTLDSTAWALYRADQFEEAWKLMQEALAMPGVRNGFPHLQHHASFIAIRAGQLEEGRALLKRSIELNPAVAAFHVHR